MSSEVPDKTELLATMLEVSRELSTQTILFHTVLADRLGLNPTDHKALDIIARAGDVTAGQLSELTGLTTGAVTGVIDRLEGAGFVKREQDPGDRRRVIVRLLPESENRIAPLFKGLGEALTGLYAQYSERELAIVLDVLTRTVHVMRDENNRLRAETGSSTRL